MAITGLVINGELFEFDRDLNQTNPYDTEILAGGVIVQWSPSDIVFLSGGSPTTTPLYGGNWSKIVFFLKAGYPSTPMYYQNLKHISSGVVNGSFVYYADFLDESTNVNSRFLCSITGKILKQNRQIAPPNAASRLHSLETYSNCSNITGYRVTSNTGQTTERTTTTAPIVTIQNEDCRLTINFADGHTEQLTYPVCPTVEPYECFNCPGLLELINYSISRLNNAL